MILKKIVPSNWDLKSIKDIGEVVTGKTPSTKIQDYFGGEIPFITPADLENTQTYIEQSLRTLTIKGLSKANLLPPNTVIVTCIGTLGKMGITKVTSATNQQINALIVNGEYFDFRYIFYAILRKFPLVINQLVGKNVVPIINKSSFQTISLPVPPLPEQRKIADILSAVDNAIQATKKVIQKTKRLKKGLMQQLLTKGMPGWHSEFKDSTIGMIPKEWMIIRLGDASSLIRGNTPSTQIKDFWNGEHLWATPTDIVPINGKILENTNRKLSQIGWETNKSKVVPANCLLVCTRATIGDLVITKQKVSFNQGITGIIPEKVETKFLAYFLPLLKRKMKQIASGTTFLELSLRDMKKLIIPIPPQNEQQKIIAVLSSIDKEVQLERKILKKLQRQKKGLMEQLLTGKIRVKF